MVIELLEQDIKEDNRKSSKGNQTADFDNYTSAEE